MNIPIYSPHRVIRSRYQASKVKGIDWAYGIFAGSVIAAIFVGIAAKVLF